MVNDAANKSHVDGVKQTATYFYLYVFLIMKWVVIVKMKPNSGSQHRNTQFLMIHILQYTVRN